MGVWAEAFQVCVFDMLRGQQEGHELDKILFFSPADWPLPSQLSVVGLSEGLITFTRIFSPDAPCDMMEAERHCHFFYQCEHDIWMVMVVEKSKDTNEPTRYATLQAMLKEAHNLFKLFFGPIRVLLEKHPAGDVARCCLYSFLPDYLADFQVGKRLRLPSSVDCLTERGMIEMFPLRPDVRQESQALISMVQSCSESESVVHVLIIFQDQLVASTLSSDVKRLPCGKLALCESTGEQRALGSQGDTSVVFSYAKLRMRPAAVSQSMALRASHRKTNSVRMDDRQARAQSTSLSHQSEARNMSSLSGDQSSIPKPLQRDAWWRGHGGFLCTDAWGTESIGGSEKFPAVWLQDSEEKMFFSAYQLKALTLLVLIPANATPTAFEHSRKQLLQQASLKIQRLEDRLLKEWGGPNASHIPSYRYLYFNQSLKVAQASPPGKVTTLSKDTLIALSRVRAEVDLEKGRLARKDLTRELQFELSMRTKNNAWVVAKTQNGHDLYVALEKSGDTLLLASESIEKLSERHFDRRFSSK